VAVTTPAALVGLVEPVIAPQAPAGLGVRVGKVTTSPEIGAPVFVSVTVTVRIEVPAALVETVGGEAVKVTV
jgi:hypothetical protein